MIELLNQKELAAIIAKIPVTDGHEELLTALHTRYPGTEFRLISEWAGRTWDAGIIDAVGNRITDSLATWINQELIAAGGDAREVWNRHKESGLIRTEREGSVLYLTAPFGADPDMFNACSTQKLCFRPKIDMTCCQDLPWSLENRSVRSSLLPATILINWSTSDAFCESWWRWKRRTDWLSFRKWRKRLFMSMIFTWGQMVARHQEMYQSWRCVRIG